MDRIIADRMRDAYQNSTLSVKEIAQMFNISPSNCSRILTNQYFHNPNYTGRPRRKPDSTLCQSLYHAGYSIDEIRYFEQRSTNRRMPLGPSAIYEALKNCE